MTVRHPHLFEALDIRGKRLRNRIVFGAHTSNMSEAGLPGERHKAYYLERAIGGAAMIVVEPMPVHRTAVLTRGNFRHDDDAVIPHFRRVVEACQEQGTVMIQQLYHVGQHGDADLSYQPNWSPSGGLSYHDSDGSHVMTVSEIEEVIEGFTRAAKRCQLAGFDGVEVWAAYHSLLDQFWTPWSNRREDEWGGSLANRTRLSTRICEAVRADCGQDFIIGLSISHADRTSVGLSIEDYQEIIERHDRLGHIDYVSCGSGSYMDYDRVMPTFVHAEKLGCALSQAMKAVVKHAIVQAESHVRTPDNADYVIASGEADLVSIVRGQIADPHLANKAREGRAEDVRGCISCNQMCWGRRSRDYWISCLINPSAGREFEWGGDRFETTASPKRVLVVGAGPAGLECSRVAAERGHQVILCEASGQIGGQFRLAGMQPRRAQILELMDWYQRQLEKLQVQLRLNSPMDVEDIEDVDADLVVLATGSLPAATGHQRWLPDRDELPGLSRGGVWSVEDVLNRTAKLGSRVIVLDEGGNWRGCGTAWYIADRGHEVLIVTPDPFIGKEIARTTADFPVRKRLASMGAVFFVESAIAEWHGDGASVISLLDHSVTRVEADSLVLATTNVAYDELQQVLNCVDSKVYAIGDCVAPRQAPYAFYEGRKIALEL